MQQSSCKLCPSGYYCVANSSSYVEQICPSGYYCPQGTEYNIQYPCTPGTFNNLTGQHNDTACTRCSPGSYCASPGLSQPTGLCDPGWYCTLGSYLAQPNEPEGGKCIAGEIWLI